MKKMSMILAVLAAMMIAGGALALTDTEAETAARAYVPAEAQLTRSEMDDGMHELTFRVEATGEKYEIQVNPNTGAVVKIESERKSASNARSTTLTDELYGKLDLNAETGTIVDRELYVGQYTADGMMTEEAARAQIATLNGTRYEFSINATTGDMV